MQTFLPHRSFEASASSLDPKRLGKQRLEARWLYDALMNNSVRANHPCAKMWKGYERSLLIYGDSMILEWIKRGYKNTMELSGAGATAPEPPWLGNERYHAAIRGVLLHKNPEYYSAQGWTDTPLEKFPWQEFINV